MKRSTKWTVALVGAVTLVGVAGAGTAIATSDDDASDRPIEGPALERAERAALAETGGGTVTGTEVGDEESLYEVEVTLEDGSQVDVQLDEEFQVVGTEGDGAHEDD
jgi:uncharacterized membrane protein YkoI